MLRTALAPRSTARRARRARATEPDRRTAMSHDEQFEVYTDLATLLAWDEPMAAGIAGSVPR